MPTTALVARCEPLADKDFEIDREDATADEDEGFEIDRKDATANEDEGFEIEREEEIADQDETDGEVVAVAVEALGVAEMSVRRPVDVEGDVGVVRTSRLHVTALDCGKISTLKIAPRTVSWLPSDLVYWKLSSPR